MRHSASQQQKKKTEEKTYAHREHFLNADGALFFFPELMSVTPAPKPVIIGLQYLTKTDPNRLEPPKRDWSRKILTPFKKNIWRLWMNKYQNLTREKPATKFQKMKDYI